MRRVFLKACLGVTTAFVLRAAENQTPQLTADDLKKMVDEKRKFFFLDVREPKELEENGTLKGYVNIPLSELESRVTEVPKGMDVVTACARGVRAAKAAVILEKHGYKVIGACGMLAYKAKGYDLVYPKAKN